MDLDQYLQPGLSLLVALSLFVLWLWARRRLRALDLRLAAIDQRQQQVDDAKERLEDALEELRTGSIGVGKRLVALEAQIAQTQAKTEALAEMEPDQRVYNKAAQLVAKGYTVTEIMDSCGLSRAEAELVVNLHKPG